MKLTSARGHRIAAALAEVPRSQANSTEHIRRVCILLACAAIWISGTLFAVTRLRTYESTPGEAALAPARWPSSAVKTQPGRSILLMWVHPECSCTAASLAELAVVLHEVRAPIQTLIVLVEPTGDWTAPESLGSIAVFRDVDGREARRFGARTSGTVMLYGSDGTLKFNGGITESRGHAGDNTGRRALLGQINQPVKAITHPGFGCALFDPILKNPTHALSRVL